MIKVQLGSKQEEKPFPKLMVSGRLIVLFHLSKHGTVLCNGVGTNMGVYSAEWDMSQFTDYNEPVTLQNA